VKKLRASQLIRRSRYCTLRAFPAENLRLTSGHEYRNAANSLVRIMHTRLHHRYVLAMAEHQGVPGHLILFLLLESDLIFYTSVYLRDLCGESL